MRKRQQKARLLVEELEPRILHSADAAALLAAPPPSQLVEIRVVDSAAPASAEFSSADSHVETPREIVFVDSAVEGYGRLVDDLHAQRDASLAVYVLDGASDGVAQIGAILAGHGDIGAIHIISHGSAGALALGSGVLDRAALERDARTIEAWGRALTADGDLLIYGCDVAAGADGEAFVDALARLTGADVAASTDITGSAARGGDWTLEYRSGAIESAMAADAAMQASWNGTLAIAADAASSAATAGAENSLTFAHTVGAGTDRLLVVEIAVAADQAVTGVTYGGVALTQLSAVTDAGNVVRAELWYMVAPTAGSANVVVSLGAGQAFVAGATSFSGVDQATPFGAAVQASGAGGTPGVTVASAAGEVVLDVVALLERLSGSADGAQSGLWTNTNGATAVDAWGGSSTAAGAPSVTMSWTTAGSGAGEWAAIAVPIKAAVDAAPVLTGSNDLASVVEDSAVNPGTLVSALISGHVTDANAGAATGIAVTAVDNTGGRWEYSTDGGTIWTAFGAASDAAARLLAADANTSVRFVAEANWNGTVANGLTFRAWDQTSGVAGATADATTNGGATAFSADTAAASVTVTGVADAPTVTDRALSFDGTDVVVVASHPSLTMTSTMTLEATIRRTGPVGPANQVIVNKEGEYELGISATGQLRWAFASTSPGWAWVDVPYTVPADTWVHVAVTYDSGVVNTYVDGVLIDTRTGSGNIGDVHPAQNDLTIGGRQNAADQRFVGLMDEVRVWNVERSAAEIQSSYRTALSGNEAGLAGYWRFNETSGTVATDATANANHGSLGGGVAADAPARTANLDYTTGEDAALVVGAPGVLAGATDPDGTTPTAVLVSGPAHAAAFTLNADGSFSYTPTANYSGADSFVFKATDGALDSQNVTVHLTVTAANDAPVLSGTNDLAGINRNPTSNPGTLVADLLTGHVTDVDAGAVYGIAVTAVDNTNGSWQYSTNGGSTWTAFGTPTDATARLLAADINTFVRFVPNTNYSGTVTNGLTFRAWDRTSGVAGATADTSASGGTSAFSAASSSSITVTAANTAPELTGATDLTAINEDAASNGGTPVSVLVAGFASDVDPGALSGIAVTAVDDTNGTWQYTLNGGTNWTSFGTPSATAARLLTTDAGTSVRFVPNADWNGTVGNGITFRAWDRTTGVAGSTADTSGTSGTFRDNFSSAAYTNNDGTRTWSGPWVENDSGGGGAGGGRFRIAGGVLSVQVAQAGDSIARGVDLTGATSAILSGTYTNSLGGAARLDLQVSMNGGAYTTVGSFTAANFGTATRSMDISAYISADTRVRFLVVVGETGAGNNEFSIDNIQIQATARNGGSTAFSTATATAGVTVNAVNDVPVRTAGTVNNLTVTEDATVTSLNLGALAYASGGGADESAQTLTYTVTAVPAASLGTITLADGTTPVTASSVYTLAQLRGMQFLAASNANGGPATFSWTVADSGGVANGGADTLTESLTVTVTAVNDAPVLSGTNNLGTINRNPTSNPGTLIADLIAGRVSDADADAMHGIAVTGVDNANGTWEYSTNGGTSWTAFGAPGTGNARLLAADVYTYVRFAPNANYSGTVTNGLTFRAWDRTSGTAGNTADVTTSGATTAFSAASASASIVVTASNTAPTLTGGNNLTAINEDASGNAGTLVSALIAGATSDADPGAMTGIAVTAVDDTNGTWEYSVNAGGNWSSFGTPSASAARLLAADANTYVRFVPNADWNGTVANGITFRAWDRSTGANGGTADTSGLAGTFRDDFTTASYSNNDGTLAWSGAWVESDALGGGAGGGRFQVTSGTLAMQAGNAGDNIYREANLSGATGATLSFTYWSSLKGSAVLHIQTSNNGGASYTTLAGGVFDVSTNTFGGSRSFDISSSIAANTRVRWVVVSGEAAADSNSFYVGNMQITATARNGGTTAFSTATATSGVTVNAVNDVPVRTAGTVSDLTVLEDAPVTSLGLGGLAYAVGGGADESAQALVYTVTAVPAAALGSVVLADGTTAVTAATSYSLAQLQGMQFKAAPNGHGGPATFSWSVSDGGGTANGGVDTLAQSLTITVTQVNDAPAGADNTVTTLEDTAYTFSASDFGFTDAADSPANALAAVRIVALPGAGSLTLSGAAVTAGQSITAADITAGNLRFAPAANANGAGYASFTFRVRDDGGVANGGVDLDPTARTLTVNVTAVNDAPAGASNTVTTPEDTAYTFTVADFGFTDAADGNALASVRIATIPAAGSLTLAGAAVSAGQSISAASIAAGDLRYTPAPDATGAAYASFTFQVRDDGGTAGGGADLDPTPRTLTVNVAAVNDAPSGADKIVTTREDTAYVFSVADFGFADAADGNTLAAVRIAAVPAAGSLTLSGAAVTAGQSISAANIAAGNLRYTPAPNANGAAYASFTFQVQDDGGVAGGGADLDPVARTMTIDVTAVNDAPTGAGSTVTLLEDSVYTFAVADFGFADAADGDALTHVRISSLPLSGTLTLGGAAVAANQLVSAASIAAGELRYTPAPDANGAAYAAFTFQVRDDGGTADGGADTDATPRTMTIAITPVNDAPAGSSTTVGTLEDTPYTFTVADFGYADPIDAASAAGANAFDAVRIAALPVTGTLVFDFVPVAAGQVVTAADIAAGKLMYMPALDGSGAAYATFDFQVRDGGGTANGGIDFDAVARTMTIAVTAVNDAPAGADRTVTTLEDTVYAFAAADFGFADAVEGDAFLGVRIASTPAAGTLTLSGVAVAANQFVSAARIAAGDLVYTPAPDAHGAAHASFTFRVQDDGGTANGGIDLDTTARTMTVAVTPVNDAPRGTSTTVTTLEDTEYRFALADFGFSDVRDGDALSAVRIVAAPGAGTLTLRGVAVAAGQVVSAASIAAGDLRYMPGANAHGGASASFSFQVRDDGGVANGGVDFDTLARTMTIDVSAVNDAPTGANAVVTTNEGAAYTFAAADFGYADPADSPASALLGVRVVAVSGSGVFTVGGVALAAGDVVHASRIAAGELQFTPGRSGSGAAYASLQFRVQDDGGTARGGADTDAATRTLTIDVRRRPEPAPAVIDPVVVLPPPPPPAQPAAAEQPAAESAPAESRAKATLARIAAELDAATARALKVPVFDAGAEVAAPPARVDNRADGVASIAAPASSAARRDGAPAAAVVAVPLLPDARADAAAAVPVALPSALSGRFAGAGAVATDAAESSAQEADAKKQAYALLTLENGVRASAIIVSAGMVTWTLHGAGLLASLLTSAPAWRHLDPLPVLAPESEKPDWGDSDGDALREEDAADRLWLGSSSRASEPL